MQLNHLYTPLLLPHKIVGGGYSLEGLDIYFIKPNDLNDNIMSKYGSSYYIIYGVPYGKFCIQGGYEKIDTNINTNGYSNVTIQFPIAFSKLYNIQAQFADTSTMDGEEHVNYFINTNRSLTNFNLVNYSAKTSGYNSYYWLATGIV